MRLLILCNIENLKINKYIFIYIYIYIYLIMLFLKDKKAFDYYDNLSYIYI